MENGRPPLWKCLCKELRDEIWAFGFETLAQQIYKTNLSQMEGNGRVKDKTVTKKSRGGGRGIKQTDLKAQN